MVDRTHRDLTGAEIARISRIYHAWRGESEAGEYSDLPGLCKSATLEDVRKHEYVLTPGRYVGAATAVEDIVPFESRMNGLSSTLIEQMSDSRTLDDAIRRNLKQLGFTNGLG